MTHSPWFCDSIALADKVTETLARKGLVKLHNHILMHLPFPHAMYLSFAGKCLASWCLVDVESSSCNEDMW